MLPADTLDLDPSPEGVAQALHWLEQLAERDGWTPRQQQALTLALDEAVTNALMHGLDGRPEARLHVRYEGSQDAATVVLVDNGRAFDPTRAPEPPPVLDVDSLAIGGRGILLMRRMVPDMTYARAGDENHLTLRVPRKPPGEGTKK